MRVCLVLGNNFGLSTTFFRSYLNRAGSMFSPTSTNCTHQSLVTICTGRGFPRFNLMGAASQAVDRSYQVLNTKSAYELRCAYNILPCTNEKQLWATKRRISPPFWLVATVSRIWLATVSSTCANIFAITLQAKAARKSGAGGDSFNIFWSYF